MKKILVILPGFIFSFTLPAYAQNRDELTLQDCYALARQNYPLVKQFDLIAKTAEYNIENLHKGYYPQLTINGQATYQSAVTEIPLKLPGVAIPVISKDQYKLYGELTQVIYDGGLIRYQKQLQQSTEAIEKQKLESALFSLKERINQLFFGVLLINEQLQQSSLLIDNIRLGLNTVKAAINNGTALKTNANVLEADLLKSKQRNIELLSARKAFTDILSLFIATPVDTGTVLVKPPPVHTLTQINRPELLIYAEQINNLHLQDKLLYARTLPRLSVYFQGGLGRPALNFLSNNFDAYYIGGIRLAWSPSVFYTLKRDRALLDINRRNVAVQSETFLFNTHLTVKQQREEVSKYRQLLESDDEITALRGSIKSTSFVQLTHGVITANDYLREANAEDQARQLRILHEIQWLMSQYNQQTTTGN